MDLIHDWTSKLLSPECADTFLVQFDILNKACFSLLLSKCLGWGIVAGAVAVKLPQIIAFLKSGSVEGVSLLAQIAELFTLTNTMTYNYVQDNPFSTWGEAFFLFLQMFVIVGLMLHLMKKHVVLLVFIGIWIGWTTVLSLGYIPFEWHQFLQSVNIPILAISRMLTIGEVVRAKTTGQLSFITSFLFFAGSLSRIFTTWKEVDDAVILAGYVIASVFNAIVVSLFMIYPKSKLSTDDKKTK